MTTDLNEQPLPAERSLRLTTVLCEWTKNGFADKDE